ncbi:MAG: PEGA domain-containing protein [Candidatus Omnitrophica bacterium]|nr:PEGA domain-containing protein [Candidatus Omnitrophota bacterium]
MYIEQRIRAILFYLSVLVFITTLPFILSFALGYKFNPKTLHFTKAGIIVLKTQPGSASIYLNDKLLDAKTPATIDELLPGTYQVKLTIENYYPWVDSIQVEAGKVSRFEKIILFPLRPQVTQLNQDRVTSFWIDEPSGLIYYVYF